MCDNYIVADIMCANGEWSDADPEVIIILYRVFSMTCHKSQRLHIVYRPSFCWTLSSIPIDNVENDAV